MRFAADENFRERIVEGLRSHGVDVMTVQEADMRRAPDPEVLAWAADEHRILLTHDERTMDTFAYERIERSEPMPGVFVVPGHHEDQAIINDILTILGASFEGEYENTVRHLPIASQRNPRRRRA